MQLARTAYKYVYAEKQQKNGAQILRFQAFTDDNDWPSTWTGQVIYCKSLRLRQNTQDDELTALRRRKFRGERRSNTRITEPHYLSLLFFLNLLQHLRHLLLHTATAKCVLQSTTSVTLV